MMRLDIYISRKTASGKECLIHWHKFGPVAEWFKEKIYNGTLDCEERPLDYLSLVFLHENCVAALDSENWKKKMAEQLFPETTASVSPVFFLLDSSLEV